MSWAQYDNLSLPTDIEDDDIVAQAFLFFLAGFDTASTLLCFASHQLAVHAHMQVRLQEEIDETLQKNDGKFTYEAVNSMKYLDMVVSGERKQRCLTTAKLCYSCALTTGWDNFTVPYQYISFNFLCCIHRNAEALSSSSSCGPSLY